MAYHSRGQQDHNNNERGQERSSDDTRRQNVSNPRMSPDNEEDVQRGKGRYDKGSRSSFLSSIDYDRNAE
ncbi:MAG: hypothetical protein WCF67_00220 [Chitinophagaceae bacterium]